MQGTTKDEILEIREVQMLVYNYENVNAADLHKGNSLPTAALCTVVHKQIRRLGRRIFTMQIANGQEMLLGLAS
jgi:hypothetical protein